MIVNIKCTVQPNHFGVKKPNLDYVETKSAKSARLSLRDLGFEGLLTSKSKAEGKETKQTASYVVENIPPQVAYDFLNFIDSKIDSNDFIEKQSTYEKNAADFNSKHPRFDNSDAKMRVDRYNSLKNYAFDFYKVKFSVEFFPDGDTEKPNKVASKTHRRLQFLTEEEFVGIVDRISKKRSKSSSSSNSISNGSGSKPVNNSFTN